MRRERAKEILMARGWDTIGADEIISQCEEDGILAEMTEDGLSQLAEDYEDR